MAEHPLMKPASWALWSGSGGSPSISRAAAVFWLLGGSMLVAWLIGLLHEALVWGISPVLALAGVMVAVGWCVLAWSTWSSWRAQRPPVTLLWTGPVREVSEQGQPVPTMVGGFRVVQWDAPVRVDILLDLQSWMLLRLTTTRQAATPQETWLWLAPDTRNKRLIERNSLHQLRSLLYLSPRLTVLPDDMPPLQGGAVRRMLQAMASWMHSIKSGSTLRSSVSRRGRLQVQQPSKASLTSGSESAFPSTLIMRDDDADTHADWRGGRRP